MSGDQTFAQKIQDLLSQYDPPHTFHFGRCSPLDNGSFNMYMPEDMSQRHISETCLLAILEPGHDYCHWESPTSARMIIDENGVRMLGLMIAAQLHAQYPDSKFDFNDLIDAYQNKYKGVLKYQIEVHLPDGIDEEKFFTGLKASALAEVEHSHMLQSSSLRGIPTNSQSR